MVVVSPRCKFLSGSVSGEIYRCFGSLTAQPEEDDSGKTVRTSVKMNMLAATFAQPDCQD